jgi:large subunit ribosomal protein L19
MTQAIIDAVEKSQLKADLPHLEVGDTVDVHVRIIEGAKERIQVFNGVIIAMKGAGISEVITVRRIVANEGVERVFPVNSPRIAKIEVKRHGHVRRAKLYYLRERVGKKRRLRDRRRGLETLVKLEKEAETAQQAAAEKKKAEAAEAEG